MSNGNKYERLWKLQSKINQMVLDGKRDLSELLVIYQAVLDGWRIEVVKPSVISIDRSSPFEPVAFIGSGWTIEEECSLVLTELDLSKVQFKTMLRTDENSIGGEKKLKRLKDAGHIRLDAKIFQTLWENKHLIPESWKETVNGNTRYIFFDGTILRDPHGYRYVLYLFWNDGGWSWGVGWLGSAWDARGPSAVLAS